MEEKKVLQLSYFSHGFFCNSYNCNFHKWISWNNSTVFWYIDLYPHDLIMCNSHSYKKSKIIYKKLHIHNYFNNRINIFMFIHFSGFISNNKIIESRDWDWTVPWTTYSYPMIYSLIFLVYIAHWIFITGLYVFKYGI